jgi:hypothetical protein
MIVVLQAGMQNDILASLSRLFDAELAAQVKSLVARERDATAQIVAQLAELDTSHLTPANHRDVLESARGKRKPEVEEIVARLSPHAIPSGDDAAVLDRALTVLLVDLAKKKFGDTSKPRRSRGTKPGARYPSAKVQRAVWVRDLGRCAFVGTSGHRCNERRFVEFHHVDPYMLACA